MVDKAAGCGDAAVGGLGKRQTGKGEKTFSAIPTFRCVSVIEGEGTIGGRAVRRGTHLIIPAAYGDATCEGKMRLIVSRVPTSL